MTASRRVRVILLTFAIAVVVIGFTVAMHTVSVIFADVRKAEVLQERLTGYLGKNCDDCYVHVFGPDRRVFVFAPSLRDAQVQKIASESFATSWVHEVDIRNTNLSEERAKNLVDSFSGKRILTRYNADHVDPFLYD